MTKRGFIQVRVSEGDKAAWEGIAEEAGLSLSGLVREAMRGLVVSRATVEEAVHRQERVVAEKVLERFVVPASCPAPSKKSFRPDFK